MKKYVLFSLMLLFALAGCGEVTETEETTEAVAQEEIEQNKEVEKTEEMTEEEAKKQAIADSLKGGGEWTPGESNTPKVEKDYDYYNLVRFEFNIKASEDPEYIDYEIKYENVGSFTVNSVSPTVEILDADGNILTSSRELLVNNLKPGQTAIQSTFISVDDLHGGEIASMSVEIYDYYPVDTEDAGKWIEVNTLAQEAKIYE